MSVDQRDLDPRPKSRSRRGLRGLLVLATVAVAVVAMVLWWLQIPWTWSPVDDPGHVNALGEVTRSNGFFQGLIEYSLRQYRGDLDWGLFRPSYWIYPSIIYVLPVEWAHVARLLMCLVAIAGPLVHFRRKGLQGYQFAFAVALLLAASSSLYIGLFLISLQELSGAALIGLGLAIRNRWGRMAAWTLAAWFKAPFAWLLIGQAVVDWRRGKRTLALSNGALGVATLAFAVVMARNGSYTSGYALDPFMIWHNLEVLLEPMNALLLVAIVWWVLATKSRLTVRLSSVVFLVGWLGYTAQLLPWFVSAYYMGPISYLFGLFVISTLPPSPLEISRTRGLVALAAPTVVAAILVMSPMTLGFHIQNSMRTFQDCLSDRPGTTSILQGNLVYVTSSPEAPIRLTQNLQLDDPTWTGSISLRESPINEAPDSTVDLILNVGPELDTADSPLILECNGSPAQVYRNP